MIQFHPLHVTSQFFQHLMMKITQVKHSHISDVLGDLTPMARKMKAKKLLELHYIEKLLHSKRNYMSKKTPYK